MSSAFAVFVGLVLVLSIQGFKLKDKANDENPMCATLVENQPDFCQVMVAKDPENYCKDHGELCPRTCRGCKPRVKPPAPQQYCEDQRLDCQTLMNAHGVDQCNEYPLYGHLYCRKYCNMC